MTVPSSSPQRALTARYLAIFAALVALVLLAVTVGNWVVDPYLSQQWESPLLQRLRPAREKLSPWGKTYAVFRYQPQVLFVGNSRTEVGLPAEASWFGGRRVFNAAISGATLGDAIAMLKHATVLAPLETVVWGVDYSTFSMTGGNTDFVEALVATDAHYLWRRRLMGLKRALSFDMTRDAIQVLTGQAPGVCRSSLAFYGQKDEACIAANLLDRGGVEKALVVDVGAARQKNAPANITQALQGFEQALARLCAVNTRVKIYINPLHALALENFYQHGHGPELDDWKRRLLTKVEAASAGGCDVALVDFSGFNSVTSEPIPQVSGQAAMHNYWEASHYRTGVGRQILARLMGVVTETVPADFGVALDQSTIEPHLASLAGARAYYRQQHPQELALLARWSGLWAQK